MNMRNASLAAVLLIAACARAEPDRPPSHAGQPPTTARDGRGSTMPAADPTRGTGAYSGAGGHGLGHPSLEPDSASAHGAAGHGAGTFAPLR